MAEAECIGLAEQPFMTEVGHQESPATSRFLVTHLNQATMLALAGIEADRRGAVVVAIVNQSGQVAAAALAQLSHCSRVTSSSGK